MKKFVLFLAVLAAMVSSAAAFADEPEAASLCPDKDGDGYFEVVQDCVPPHGKKPGDCDDEHASIHPNAQEVWDDGIDNDCKVEAWDSQDGDNKGDRVSLGAVQVARFARGLGRSITPASPSELRLLKDINSCKNTDDGGCKVDYVGGKFNVKEAKGDEAGYRAVDVDCNGVLDFVSDDYSPTLKDQAGCRKAAARAAAVAAARHKASAAKLPAAVTLPGQATSTTAPATAPKAPAKGARNAAPAVDYSAPIAAAQASAEEAKTTAYKAMAKAEAQGEKLNVLDQAIAEQKKAIDAETARAKAAENEIDTKAQAASDLAAMAKETADEAKELAGAAGKQGVVVELALGGAMVLNHDVHAKLGKDSGKYKAGDVLKFRGNSASGAFVGLNVGYANKDTRFTGFFNLLPLADEGPEGWESSIAYQGGVEATFKALHGFGGHALFQQHDAGGSVVGANAYSRGGGVGLSYVGSTSGSNFKVGFQGRATVGLEAYGAGKGSDIAPFAGISLGINFGFGPK